LILSEEKQFVANCNFVLILRGTNINLKKKKLFYFYSSNSIKQPENTK